MFKILDECTAMVRKSFEGLDNYVKEGCRGFTHLESLLEKLHVDINVDEYNKYKEGLQQEGHDGPGSLT